MSTDVTHTARSASESTLLPAREPATDADHVASHIEFL